MSLVWEPKPLMPTFQTPQQITVLVGTMTGTAEMVAQEAQIAIEEAGHSVSIVMMDNINVDEVAEGGVFLICTSTYGNGDVPDNAQALVKALKEQRPDLSNVLYGVIALGDMTYKATFCQGGLQFDALFGELGARRAGPPLCHDASSGTLPEDVALEWVKGWVRRDLAPMLEAA
jgi:MioC protein